MIVRRKTVRDASGQILSRQDLSPPAPPPVQPSAFGLQPSSAPPGLGDLVERIARPIARAIDRAFGTKLASCGACKKRRDWLNQHFRRR